VSSAGLGALAETNGIALVPVTSSVSTFQVVFNRP